MKDDMFFSEDSRSLRRGKRRAVRTEVCRPCLMWPKYAADTRLQGVVMDVSPYGMLIRTLGAFTPGTPVMIQLMRDEEFQEALAAPFEGMVVRHMTHEEGFTDQGVQILQRETPQASAPLPQPRPRPRPASTRRRMYTLDFTVGDDGIRRTGR